MIHWQMHGLSGLGDMADDCFATLAEDPDNVLCKAYVSAHTTHVADWCQTHQDNPLCLIQRAPSDCQAKADLDTYNLDQLAYGLAQNWNPTSYFTGYVIRQVVAKQVENSADARRAIASVWGAATDDQRKSILQDRLDSLDLFDQQGQKYLAAAQDAGDDGIVEADKLKTWAIGALQAMSSCLHAAEVVTCEHDRNWNSLVAMGDFLYTVGGLTDDALHAAYNAGKTIVQSSEWLLGALGWIVGHAWQLFGAAVLAGGGAIAYKHRDTLRAKWQSLRRH